MNEFHEVVGGTEPAVDEPAVREFPDPDYQPKRESLGEIRKEMDEITAKMYEAVAPLLARRTELVIDATRFKENEDQVAAVDRQMEVLSGIQTRAEDEGFPYPNLIVDIFDAIVTGSVELQQEAFKRTRPIAPGKGT